jgi:hypothetical protein
MQFRGLLIAALVLAGLAGGVWWSNKAEKDKEGKPAPDAPPKIAEIPADQIKQVDILKGGETITVKRGEGDKWSLTSPKPFRADQDAVSGVTGTFSSLTSDRLIEEKATDLKSYGLDAPKLTVTVTKKDGKATKFLIGDETPTAGGFFVKMDGDPRVFTIPSFSKSNLDKSWKDLQDKRLLTFDSEKLSRIELTVKGQTVEFGKNNNNEWTIVRPKPLRADGGHIEELVRKLKDAKMDAAVTEEDARKAAAAFGGAALIGIARSTDASGTQELEVRKDTTNNYYARSSAVEGVHKVTSDLGDALNKSVDDFRNKKLFDFGWNDPSKIEIRDGARTLSFQKQGDKWMSGAGKQMDSTSVQSLIDKLRDLSAAKFLDAGFTSSVFDATVTSNEGKRVEKISISKTGDKYFAQRQNEPAVYEIETKAFEDLQRAAGDVKEPPPPAPAKKDDAKKK